jgi:hypothetical protein
VLVGHLQGLYLLRHPGGPHINPRGSYALI